MRIRHLKSSARAGFTLMELLVVVAILLVLAGTSIFTYQALFSESKESVARTQCRALAEAMDRFATRPASGFDYPDEEAGWQPLLIVGDLKEEPIDPWGQPYRWKRVAVGDVGKARAFVWSCGDNKTDEGGAGDDPNSN